jgi:hypothetical protein
MVVQSRRKPPTARNFYQLGRGKGESQARTARGGVLRQMGRKVKPIKASGSFLKKKLAARKPKNFF